MNTTSFWIDSASLPHYSALTQNIEVDVVVVGGGITGVTAAYLLKKAGKKVALVERGRCAEIDTGHTTAHLTCVTDTRFRKLAKSFSKDVAKAVWDAGSAAVDQIVNNIRAEEIDCDFKWVSVFLHAPLKDPTENDTQDLKDEADFLTEIGIQVSYLNSVPVFNRPGIEFRHQALFHPRKYLSALLGEIDGGGSYVFEHTAVEEVQEKPLSVRSGDHHIVCAHVILATHTPLTGKTEELKAMLFQTKLALYTSYAIGAKVPKGKIPEASFWDTSDPYYYLRVDQREEYDYAIFGGEDHKTGQAEDTEAVYRRLEVRLRQFCPQAKVDHRWSGQVIETNDGLPFMGATADRQFAATGFAGNGMTFGILGAMMAVDYVVGRKNPWSDLFEPNRKKLIGGTWEYIKENKDYPYFMLRDWLGGSEGKSLDVLKRKEGKILNLHGKKVAAYRDAHGKVSLCSPVCTHLKCIVGWNNAEQTWDCPCHGSRFSPDGDVISGPAETPLEKIGISEVAKKETA
ncbi:MAG TPA: FAD-dependent oxidoreductase [Opitutaceae bacterium]|nr:FAD-dependent oxidoreductase [Opitutaceae bacterium]